MSTDLYVVLGHRLNGDQIETLPALLNEYSHDRGLFRLRFSHHLSGEIQEQDGKWVWQPDVDPDWELDEGVLVSEEHWDWEWKPDRDGDFWQWFEKNREHGHLRLTSTRSSSLHIGPQSAVVSPTIRWRNFFG